MPKIYDNIENHFVQGLTDVLGASKRADFCVGYFNMRGWKEVADKIEALEGEKIFEGEDEIHRSCRLLVGMQKLPVDILKEHFSVGQDSRIDNNEANKIKKRLAREFKEQLTIGIPTDADEAALRKLSNQMKTGKVVVKLHLKHTLHAKLYLAFSNDIRVPVFGFLGSSNLTLAGLAKQGELNIDVLDQDAANKLAQWFEDRWNDRWCIDITKELIEIIDTSWAAERLLPPYHIYLKIAYHLSREARAGISEFKLPKVFKTELLEFQQKAVLVAAHHIHKRGGVMIGDVVGLGKTITASAIAKILEDDFSYETLILCPKNLKEMWEGYAHKYELRAKVVSHSEAQNALVGLRRFRVVIIDESHNLRNDHGRRYQAIKNYITENDSKVILLTATPYNKTFYDLSNQLRLFIPDDMDLGISPEQYIEHIGGQVQFAATHPDTFVRSIKAFERSNYADDWRELMRLYLVRRTRSFIKTNYALDDPQIGKKYLEFADGSKQYFPDRLPKKVEFEFNAKDKDDQYARLYAEDIVRKINSLELPRYGLGNYIELQKGDKLTDEEKTILDNLSRAGKRLMGFCRTNLFKRLESSGHSFLLSLARHVLRNAIYMYAIENGLPLPIGKSVLENLDDFLEDGDTDADDGNGGELRLLLDLQEYKKKAKEVYSIYHSPEYNKRFEWISHGFFNKSLSAKLQDDSKAIIEILKIGDGWNTNEDRKLIALKELLTVTHKKEKVIVFTQFADTARYISEYVRNNKITELECVTGDNENPTAFAHRFSPVSNGKPEIKNTIDELRVLIATDVLSEGQNLQDAHIIVNYDLPWAIIRLIQRAGRVDRIGQKSSEIICYSFLPEDGIDNIIKLRGRLTTRITENAEVVGSDERFFDGDPINIADLYNERAGILDDDDSDADVDLASYAYQIWKNAIDKEPSLQRTIPDMPDVVYSSMLIGSDEKKPGVIVYARTSEDNDVLTWMGLSGEVITQSQLAILKGVKCEPDTPPVEKHHAHHDIVQKAVSLIVEDEKSTGGALGKKSGLKYRLYKRLESICALQEGTLFINEQLKKAVDDIYKYPMKESARDTISRQLKSGISDIQLVDLVVSLREGDKLCVVTEDEEQIRTPQIICSMGLLQGENTHE